MTKDDQYTGDKDVEMWKLNPKWDPQAAWDGNPETGELTPNTKCRKTTRAIRSRTPAANPSEIGRHRQTASRKGKQQDPLGVIPRWFPSLAAKLRQPGNWMSIVGLIGLLLHLGIRSWP